METIKELGLAIVGCGRWGMNHVKTASALFGGNLVMVADMNPAAAETVKKISTDIEFTPDLEKVAADERINAVIVATPAETHYAVTKKLLQAGKNVLVEKPLTILSIQAQALVDFAEVRHLKLMVGHVLLYHPAVRKLKELLKSGKVGKLQYVYSNRLNFGTVRSEENILWSFAPHDISIIQMLTGSNPIWVGAWGASFLQPHIEDSTVTCLSYPSNVNAHIFVSWLHPFKEQRLVVIGDKGMIVFEDNLPKDKLKFYPKHFAANHGTIEKFDGEYEIIPHEEGQPLEEEQRHFAECVMFDRRPLTDGKHALEVLAILEKAERSVRENGVKIAQREFLCQ